MTGTMLLPRQRRLTDEEMKTHLEHRAEREKRGERLPDLAAWEPIVEVDANDQSWLIYRRRETEK